MNKGGQFFLIAAFAIIAVLIGLMTIYTNVEVPKETAAVFDLSKEINYESCAVIDSGVFNALTKAERNSHLENLTDYYAAANPNTDLIIIYGDRNEMYAVFYTTKSAGSVKLDLGGDTIGDSQTTQGRYNTTFNPGNEEDVTIIIDENITHTFKIKPGQTFFLVLKKEIQGERYVGASRSES